MAERKAFLLRISPELWESLEQWAADELRSVNGQIEFVLAQAPAVIPAGGPLSPVPPKLARAGAHFTTVPCRLLLGVRGFACEKRADFAARPPLGALVKTALRAVQVREEPFEPPHLRHGAA